MPSLPAWRALLNSDNRDAVLKMREADYALHSVPRKIGTPLTVAQLERDLISCTANSLGQLPKTLTENIGRL